MNILIFGGTGFIGSNLVPRLLSEGHVLTILDRQRPYKRDEQLVHRNIKYQKCDIEKIDSLENSVKNISNIDLMIYLVSTTKPSYSNENPIYDINSNLNSLVNLFQIKNIGLVKKIIYISSGGTVYGNQLTERISESHQTSPIVSYGIVKLAIEKYLLLYQKKYNNKLNILRVSNPYGPGQTPGEGQGLIANIIKRSLEKSQIEIFGDGKLIRDYIYIDDLIEAIIKSMDYDGNEKIFNIGTGVGTTINRVVDIIGGELNFFDSKNKKYIESRAYDLDKNILDISLAKKELNWSPKTDLNHGINKTIEWAKNHGDYLKTKNTNYKISIIVPCFNEEQHIYSVIEEIVRYRSKNGLKIEIIIVNDCSSDGTKECVLREMKIHSDIFYLEHSVNRGIGASFKTGLKFSSGEYVLLIPGDGENSVAHALYAHSLLSNVDIVIPFIIDKKLRSIERRILSNIYTFIINAIFFTNLKYFNGSSIYRANIIKSINIKSNSFFYQTEILVKLIKLGYNFAEVPIHLNRKSNGFPKALNVNQLLKVIYDLLNTINSLYIKKLLSKIVK